MISKIAAICALVVLPLSITMWHKSHKRPEHYRFDVTPYKSLRVHLKNGVCSLRLLDMPTKTAGKSEFRGSLNYSPAQANRFLMLRTVRKGPNRITWLVFPFWLSTSALTLMGTVPFARAPIRVRWRKWHGLCLECGYNLRGNRSGRCSECGTRFRWKRLV